MFSSNQQNTCKKPHSIETQEGNLKETHSNGTKTVGVKQREIWKISSKQTTFQIFLIKCRKRSMKISKKPSATNQILYYTTKQMLREWKRRK